MPEKIPIILARGMRGQELEAAELNFDVVNLRSKVPPGSLVIARYSALPYYRELEADLLSHGSEMINTHRQHRYVADLGNWVEDLSGMTPKTWNRLEDVPESEAPFIVKGETNSKKFSWDTHFFAPSKQDAVRIACDLMDDGLLCDQKIYVRKYVKLVKLMDGLRGMPISEEYRFFALDGKIVCGGFYWSNYVDDLGEEPSANCVPREFLDAVLEKIGNKVRFVVIDVARLESGEWIVVELNDGQMSGLSCNDPELLYCGLKTVLGIPSTREFRQEMQTLEDFQKLFEQSKYIDD